MQTITPHLWFDRQAREAAEFYAELLPGSKVTKLTVLPNTPSGDCELVSFELAGQPFMAISAGPLFRFNPAVSFHIKCSSTEEVNAIWERLSAGAKVFMPLDKYPFSERYGWLEDRYGVSWQVIHAGGTPVRQRLTPVLMFVGSVCGKAEEAMEFCVSVFRNAPDGEARAETSATVLARYGKGEEPDKEGTVRYGRFALARYEFGAMDSARDHKFTFNEAISFMVPCGTQEEIDYFWGKLSADPKAEQCGWLKDRYGLSWQIVPARLGEWMGGGDRKRIERVTQALLKMKRLDIGELERAAAAG